MSHLLTKMFLRLSISVCQPSINHNGVPLAVQPLNPTAITMGACQSNHSTTPAKDKKLPPARENGSFVYQRGTCALEYWEPVQEIGEGSISSIHLVRRRPHRIDVPYEERVDIMSLARNNRNTPNNTEKELFALKSILKTCVRNEQYLQEMRNEIYTMSHLRHPHVVRVYEAYERKRHIYLIMEYCSGGDLLGREPNEAEAACIVRKILQAVEYLHAHKVVHRDLKLENIMFDRPTSGGGWIGFHCCVVYLDGFAFWFGMLWLECGAPVSRRL